MQRSFQDRSARVLIVDDDVAHRAMVEQVVGALHRPKIESYLADSLQQALGVLDAVEIDLCLCDFRLADGSSAVELLNDAHQHGHHIPFVALTEGADEDAAAHELLIAGFDDVLHKNELRSANLYRLIRNSWLRNLRSRNLERFAMTDPLTELSNRRSLDARLQLECDRREREPSDLAVMYLDLDAFKRINDEFGHAAGDHTLRRVAQVLESSVRKTDVVARIGGDEFAIVLPNCPFSMAQNLLEKVCRNIDQTVVDFQENLVRVSVSAGMAMFDRDAGQHTPASLLNAADEAMYRNKQTKRKKTVINLDQQPADRARSR